MPPKIKTTKEQILEAAFEIVRREGIEKLNARAVAQALHCSTQPIMYNFDTTESLKIAVYEKADAFHSAYLMDIPEDAEDPMLEIGTAYVRFAATEKQLFRFLFQSDHFSHQNFLDLVENEALIPVLDALAENLKTDRQHAEEHFMVRFLMVHGLASLLANNSMEYDEEKTAQLIQNMFYAGE